MRYVVEHERIGGVHQPRVVVRKPGDLDRPRPGGDDRALEPDLRRPFGGRDAQAMRRGERPFALYDLHLALPREPGEPAGEPRDDPVLPARELRQIDRRRAELDAVRGHLRRAVDDRGGVEQGLRGDAPDVEADPAQGRVALDEHGAQAQVGGAERGGVPARSRPEDHDLRLDGRGSAHRVTRRPVPDGPRSAVLRCSAPGKSASSSPLRVAVPPPFSTHGRVPPQTPEQYSTQVRDS